MKTVVFAYTHSAARAQTAAALFNQMSNHNLAKAIAASLGEPVPAPANFVATMREYALDVSAATEPQALTPQLAELADALILVDDASTIQELPTASQEDWSPAGPDFAPDAAPDFAEDSEPHALYEELRPRVWKLIARQGWWKLQPLMRERPRVGRG